jgi:sugar phosphate isomerase/epimerase
MWAMRLPPDIGLPTDALYRLPLAAALERVAERAELAEIYSSDDHSLLVPANRRAGQPAATHRPRTHRRPRAGSPRERIRRCAVHVHRHHLEAAAEIGALTYVVHPDCRGCALPRDPRGVDALQRTFAALEELQRELGVRVVVKNMPGIGFSHFGAPGDLDLGELGLILDAGHAAICGTLHDFLREPHAELAHVHLQDNRRPADAGDPHLPLGRGIVDSEAVLRAARASGARVILEVLNEAATAESVAYLERRGIFTPT